MFVHVLLDICCDYEGASQSKAIKALLGTVECETLVSEWEWKLFIINMLIGLSEKFNN